MEYIIVGGFVAGVLFFVHRLITATKADSIIARIKNEESQKKTEAYQKDLAKLTQEIKDADIRYNTAKRNAGKSSDSGDRE